MFYAFVRGLAKIVVKILFNLKVQGTSELPEEGPVIVCCNHTSWWDPVILACIFKRPIHFMAKKELFGNPIFKYLLTKLNAFPVDRGTADMSAIRTGLSLLKSGKVVGIFPEGTRQKDSEKLGAAHAGAALLAIRGNAVVFPVAIRSRYAIGKSVRVKCGEPFSVSLGEPRISQGLQQGASEIMQRIKQLWEELGPMEAA